MSKVRGRVITQEERTDRKVWRWRVGAFLWQFSLDPTRFLYRDGRAMLGMEIAHVLCVDDAVLYSLGFEAGFLTGKEWS